MSADQEAAPCRAPSTRQPRQPRPARSRTRLDPRWLAAACVLAAIAACALFLLHDLPEARDYVLPLRARKVAALALVGVAVAVSTVLFQTVTANRILTPGIMGFDAVYLMIQTVLVFFIGVSATSGIDGRLQWLLEVILMVAIIGALSQWLFVGAGRDLQILVLVGIVVGTLFRSLTSLMQRMLDPTAFATLQDSFFASFGAVDETLIGITAVVVALALAGLWRLRATLDVIGLGREAAIGLGVDHRRSVMVVLMVVAVLVSVSTALVGPITFFGLLVAHLAYRLVGHRHAVVLPAAAGVAVLCLVGGQVLLERVFDFATGLSIIIDFAGGILFLALVLRRSRL